MIILPLLLLIGSLILTKRTAHLRAKFWAEVRAVWWEMVAAYKS